MIKKNLIVCRSKSGGAHVFLFTKEFIPASLMQGTLKKISKVLNTKKEADAFLKQFYKVVINSLLHLLRYNDKTKSEKEWC